MPELKKPTPTSPPGTQAVAAVPYAPAPPEVTGFRRFFLRGLAALMPTLVTLWLLVWLWNFLWNSIGQHVIFGIRWTWLQLVYAGLVDTTVGEIRAGLNDEHIGVRLLGVTLAILLVWMVGVLIGNLIGRTMYRWAEQSVMKLPLIRAIYPAVKQITDFVLSERKNQFSESRVVAVQARAQGIWSIGFITNSGYGPLNEATDGDMVTVFIPSTPTAFTGYVVVAHREKIIELPLTVEETMRLLVSGGVIVPKEPAPGFSVIMAAAADEAASAEKVAQEATPGPLSDAGSEPDAAALAGTVAMPEELARSINRTKGN